MLQAIGGFFMAIMLALVVENALFSRALASSEVHILAQDYRNVLATGVAVTFMTVLSSVLSWGADLITRRMGLDLQLRSVAFLVCICIVHQGVSILLNQKMPGMYAMLSGILNQSAFNSAVFGALMLSSMKSYGLLGFLGYGLGTGIGMTLALLLVNVGTQHLKMSNIPRSFKGLPITLLYIGIISLAIYGLIGHQLPS